MTNVLIVASTRLRGSLLAQCIVGGISAECITISTVDEVWTVLCSPGTVFDAVLIDHDRPLSERLELLRVLRETRPNSKCIITGVPDQSERARAEIVLRYFECGADGYVSIDASCEQLLAVLDGTTKGEILADPSVRTELVRQITRLRSALNTSGLHARTDRSAVLSQRQHEVLELLAEGMTNREIADRLYISIGTVKNHVHAILTALDVESRKEATMIYRLMRQNVNGAS